MVDAIGNSQGSGNPGQTIDIHQKFRQAAEEIQRVNNKNQPIDTIGGKRDINRPNKVELKDEQKEALSGNQETAQQKFQERIDQIVSKARQGLTGFGISHNSFQKNNDVLTRIGRGRNGQVIEVSPDPEFLQARARRARAIDLAQGGKGQRIDVRT